MAKQQTINVDIMRGPILEVWNAIGGDSEQAFADMGETIKNTHAIEACIDANRLTTFVRDKAEAASAEAELDRAIDAHGYNKVLRVLSRRIPLV